ncbi:MAG: hypothetical protein WKF91_07040 [Segetibacter sp.]
MGGLNYSSFVSKIIKSKEYQGDDQFKIMSYDATANEFTVSTSSDLSKSASNLSNILFSDDTKISYFVNADLSPAGVTETIPLQKNSIWTSRKNSSNERTYKVTLNGLNKVTAPETRLASWTEQ